MQRSRTRAAPCGLHAHAQRQRACACLNARLLEWHDGSRVHGHNEVKMFTQYGTQHHHARTHYAGGATTTATTLSGTCAPSSWTTPQTTCPSTPRPRVGAAAAAERCKRSKMLLRGAAAITAPVGLPRAPAAALSWWRHVRVARCGCGCLARGTHRAPLSCKRERVAVRCKKDAFALAGPFCTPRPPTPACTRWVCKRMLMGQT